MFLNPCYKIHLNPIARTILDSNGNWRVVGYVDTGARKFLPNVYGSSENEKNMQYFVAQNIDNNPEFQNRYYFVTENGTKVDYCRGYFQSQDLCMNNIDTCQHVFCGVTNFFMRSHLNVTFQGKTMPFKWIGMSQDNHMMYAHESLVDVNGNLICWTIDQNGNVNTGGPFYNIEGKQVLYNTENNEITEALSPECFMDNFNDDRKLKDLLQSYNMKNDEHSIQQLYITLCKYIREQSNIMTSKELAHNIKKEERQKGRNIERYKNIFNMFFVNSSQHNINRFRNATNRKDINIKDVDFGRYDRLPTNGVNGYIPGYFENNKYIEGYFTFYCPFLNKKISFTESELNNLPDFYSPLNNIGATCYFNATNQLLRKNRIFYMYLLKVAEEIFDTEADFNTCIKGLPHNKPKILLNNLPKVTVAMCDFVLALYRNKKAQPLSPYYLKEITGEQNEVFKGIAANDARTLFQFYQEQLFEESKLHDEYNFCKNENAVDVYNDANVLSGFNTDGNKRVLSPIGISVSYEKIRNTLMCCAKGHKKYSYQTASLNIAPVISLSNKNKDTFGYKSSNGKCLVPFSMCNQLPSNSALLNGPNQIHCNDCGFLTDAYEIQTVEMFNPTSNHTYLSLERGGVGTMSGGETFDANVVAPLWLQAGEDNYWKLSGIIVHYGVLDGKDSGMSNHFVALTKDEQDGKWYLYNDGFKRQEKTEKEVQKMMVDHRAYILTFTRATQAEYQANAYKIETKCGTQDLNNNKDLLNAIRTGNKSGSLNVEVNNSGGKTLRDYFDDKDEVYFALKRKYVETDPHLRQDYNNKLSSPIYDLGSTPELAVGEFGAYLSELYDTTQDKWNNEAEQKKEEEKEEAKEETKEEAKEEAKEEEEKANITLSIGGGNQPPIPFVNNIKPNNNNKKPNIISSTAGVNNPINVNNIKPNNNDKKPNNINNIKMPVPNGKMTMDPKITPKDFVKKPFDNNTNKTTVFLDNQQNHQRLNRNNNIHTTNNSSFQANFNPITNTNNTTSTSRTQQKINISASSQNQNNDTQHTSNNNPVENNTSTQPENNTNELSPHILPIGLGVGGVGLGTFGVVGLTGALEMSTPIGAILTSAGALCAIGAIGIEIYNNTKNINNNTSNSLKSTRTKHKHDSIEK